MISRTPSPSPSDSMDVDGGTNMVYDRYIRGEAREIITVETKIKPTNIGFAMLSKLGWTEGQPLGLSGDGRVDPIPFQVKRDLTGLGKINQDVRMIETTVSQRRGLDSERQRNETEDQRRAREEIVARKTALESEISSTLKAFYCTLCDKQFKNVAQYDEHTNSYAHHHKARYRDMQANIRLKPQDEADKRKEKERKREEKELRKIAAANGIKMPKPATTLSTISAPEASSNLEAAPPKPGWASIGMSSGPDPPPPQQGFKRSGWATVGSTSATTLALPPPPTPPPVILSRAPAPAFRTGGWTSLDTGSSQSIPPSPPTDPAPMEPPPPISSRGGWVNSFVNS
ncbi:hypothetical protein BD779DRAFT_3051 [Infundibulicybe gibba]|nr:hypothetical protein BD779DRAFT_3051 [Infundibulicybe gibba]